MQRKKEIYAHNILFQCIHFFIILNRPVNNGRVVLPLKRREAMKKTGEAA